MNYNLNNPDFIPLINENVSEKIINENVSEKISTKFDVNFDPKIKSFCDYLTEKYFINLPNDFNTIEFTNDEEKVLFLNNVELYFNLNSSWCSSSFITSPKNPLLDLIANRLYLDELSTTETLLLNQFLICSFYLNINKIKCNLDLNSDFTSDLLNLERRVLSLMQNNMKEHLRKIGISLTNLKFVGFDTEFEPVDFKLKLNEMISAQFASNCKFYLKIPKTCEFSLNLSDVNKWMEGLSCNENDLTNLLIKEINSIVNEARKLSFVDYDKFTEALKDFFKNDNDNFNFFDNKDYYLVSSKLSKNDEKIVFTNEFYFNDLLSCLKELNSNVDKNNLQTLLNALNKVRGTKENTTVNFDKLLEKPAARFGFHLFDNVKLNVSVKNEIYLCLHESAADLSMLKDFKDIKCYFDIVKRSFVTRGNGISIQLNENSNLLPENLKNYAGIKFPFKLHVRDTSLIAPAGVKSLASIGAIYGDEYSKIDIGSYRQGNMKSLLNDNKNLFIEYAMRDSFITLKHCNEMEHFYCLTGRHGVPLTLSGVGKAYVFKEWDSEGFKGYEYRKDIPLGDLGGYLSPKNLRNFGMMDVFIKFMKSYRGGRNESFIYGELKDKKWFDYDLTSAYTTVMSILGTPDYDKYKLLNEYSVKELKNEDFIYNYILLEVKFKFKEDTKFPNIPCFVDNDTDAYVLEGESIITGPEYLVAKQNGCDIKIKGGVLIPFKNDSDSEDSNNYNKPFYKIINGLQEKRRQHEKKTFYNYMYKEIGNSIYGQVSMGLNIKKAFDTKTRTYQKITGSSLANPVLASYITGFTRAVIGECLNNINKLNGNVISVTTDGFISDTENLENKILSSELTKENTYCLKAYKNVRCLLSKDDAALEIKLEESGNLLSWKTRGQLALNPGSISAMTGFQKSGIDNNFLYNEFRDVIFNKESKAFDFIQTRLRSATDIFKDDRHMQMVYRDQVFNLGYDNKREIIRNENEDFLLTKPWRTVNNLRNIRVLKKGLNTPVFGPYLIASNKGYKTLTETAIRNFIKIIFNDCEKFNLDSNAFKNYNEIINFVNNFNNIDKNINNPNGVYKITKQQISNLRHRKTISRTVNKNEYTEKFVNYVLTKFPKFNKDLFFKQSKRN